MLRQLFLPLAIMAGITFVCRAVTMLLGRKKIKNRFAVRFLDYLPFGVLAAMVVPDIFFSTASLVSAIAGLIVALTLAYFKRGLLIVALSATAAVLVTEVIMTAAGVL